MTTQHLIGKKVIIRTYSAGVHYGVLDEHDGSSARLRETRRIWYWEGAFTLSAVAVNGISKQSKLSIKIPEINLTDVIEVIPVDDNAAAILDNYPSHKP